MAWEAAAPVSSAVAQAARGVGVHIGFSIGIGAHQALDHLDDQWNRLDRAHVVVGWQHPQRGHVGPEEIGLPQGQFAPVNADGVGDADVFALACKEGTIGIQAFFIRGGQNWGHRSFFPAHTADVEPDEVLTQFLTLPQTSTCGNHKPTMPANTPPHS